MEQQGQSDTTKGESQSCQGADKPSSLSQIWEMVRYPLLFAGIAAVATWLIWFFTTEPCTAYLAKTTGCSQGSFGKIVNLAVFNKILTHGAIVFGGGGAYNYAMLRLERQRADSERRAREDADRRADSERRAREDADRRADSERRAREDADRRAEAAERRVEELTRAAASDSQEQANS